MTDRASDEAAIRALFAVQSEGWRAADGVLNASVFAEDADFINILAQTLRGRTEIAEHHQRLFEGIYSGTAPEVSEPRIRFIRPDVALVESEATLRFGAEVRHAHALSVAVHNGERWEFAAVHNMIPLKPNP